MKEGLGKRRVKCKGFLHTVALMTRNVPAYKGSMDRKDSLQTAAYVVCIFVRRHEQITYLNPELESSTFICKTIHFLKEITSCLNVADTRLFIIFIVNQKITHTEQALQL